MPWASNKTARLDLCNGLYLSATYDAAFDQHLFTLDEDYRLVLGPALKAQGAQPSVQAYFIEKEG
ncbi:HNH endonuclease [Marinagarivorans algicola]|uniref:HNH endonuclease n=1 Tax=Marinagarivorans algicola TaxID=1513270 RepID=UPI0006B9CE58|nr:HNH endonuclease [Marinagarivorans algicola]